MRTVTTYLDKSNNKTTKEKAWTIMTQVYNDAGNLQRTGYTLGEAQLKEKSGSGGSSALKVTSADNGKSEIFSKNIIKIGRDEKCDFIIGEKSEKKIDKVHAMFESCQGKWFITDMSKSGTSLNGQKLTPNVPCELHAGDVICFAGKISFCVE